MKLIALLMNLAVFIFLTSAARQLPTSKADYYPPGPWNSTQGKHWRGIIERYPKQTLLMKLSIQKINLKSDELVICEWFVTNKINISRSIQNKFYDKLVSIVSLPKTWSDASIIKMFNDLSFASIYKIESSTRFDIDRIASTHDVSQSEAWIIINYQLYAAKWNNLESRQLKKSSFGIYVITSVMSIRWRETRCWWKLPWLVIKPDSKCFSV